jgi:hypothetical protein
MRQSHEPITTSSFFMEKLVPFIQQPTALKNLPMRHENRAVEDRRGDSDCGVGCLYSGNTPPEIKMGLNPENDPVGVDLIL